MAGSTKVNLEDVSVLVVEDEPALANVVRRFLAAAGAVVTQVSTTEAARAAVDGGARWDLILLDQKLPDGDGLEVLGILEGLERRPAVVAISGNLQDSKRSLRLQAFRATLLPKPFDRADLLNAVTDALGRVEQPKRAFEEESGERAAVLRFGTVSVHLLTQTVRVGEDLVDLQPAQFRILARMVAAPGRAFTVRELVEGSLRGTHGDGSPNIRFQIHSLRRRLGVAGKIIERAAGGYGVGLEAMNRAGDDDRGEVEKHSTVVRTALPAHGQAAKVGEPGAKKRATFQRASRTLCRR